jgi:hypothetical protein
MSVVVVNNVKIHRQIWQKGILFSDVYHDVCKEIITITRPCHAAHLIGLRYVVEDRTGACIIRDADYLTP